MKRFSVIGALGTLVAVAFASGCTSQAPTTPIAAGPMTEAQYIARGEYVAQSADCIACHTPFGPTGPDMTRAFSGGNVFFIPGVSISVTQNITPREGSKIKDMSVDQLATYLKNLKALPPMLDLSEYTDEDRKALAYYLKSLTPMPNQVPRSWQFAKHQPGDNDWPRRPGMTESTGFEVTGLYEYDAALPPLTQAFIDQQIASASVSP